MSASVAPRERHCASYHPRLRRHSLRQLFAQVAAPQYPLVTADSEVGEELLALCQLDLANRTPGADVRKDAYAIARTDENRRRLEQSDELVEKLPGHANFRRKRRWGIPRFLATEGSQKGLPLFTVQLPAQPSAALWPDTEIHWGAYLDELEWEPYWIVRTDYGWRPTFAVLNSFAMRSVLWLPATYFYSANANLLIPGRLLPETKYDTETVMRWVFREAHRLSSSR